MSDTITERPFLTIPEVAGLLGVSQVRAYALAKDGFFPSVRLSERRIRVPRQAFEAWVQAKADEATAEYERGQDQDDQD
jgi:excisionase family DNA binding protein